MNFDQMNLNQQAFSQVDDSPAPDLSVVAPCYNEQDGLDEVHRQVASVCEQLGRPYEIVLVNDGSTDHTWNKMLELASVDPHLVCVKLSRNHGHQLALTAGLTICRGKRILIIDADLQDPPKLLPDMLKLMDRGADVVYGQRQRRAAESAFKMITAKLFYRVLERMTDVAIPRDTGDFRLISRRALNALLAMPERHRFIRGMVSWIGFNQVPLLYNRGARFAGETKYPLRKMWRLAVDAITGFSTKPLRFANLAGFLTSLLAFGLVIFSIVSYFQGKTIAGWTSVIAVVALLSGTQMFVLGILGEYIGRLYEESKGRPLFLIDQIIRAGSAINGDQMDWSQPEKKATSPAPLRPVSNKEPIPEFNKYSSSYSRLLDDPIRNRFAPDSCFFFERKWFLLRQFWEHLGRDPLQARWLDFGCGKGDLLRFGQNYFTEVVGCDVADGMLQDCTGLEVRRQESPLQIPFADGSFDLITAACVYHHVDLRDQPTVTKEIMRVLKPDGIFCLVEHNPFNPVTRLIVRRTPVDANARLLTARTAKRLMRGAGLHVLQTSYFLYFPESLYRGMLAWLENRLSWLPLGGQYGVFAQKNCARRSYR